MRTVGRHRPRGSPSGDTVRLCGYCGIAYYRSDLRRDASGVLCCPADSKGRDVVTLSEGNAMASSQRQAPQYTVPSDGTVDPTNTDTPPSFNWNGVQPSIPNAGPTGALSVTVLAWQRADVVTLGAAGGVAKWNDRSNIGNHLVAGTLAAQPAYSLADATLSGLPVVTFDGANHFLLANNLQNRAPLWVWIIAKNITWVTGSQIWTGGFALTQNPGTPSMRLLRNAGSTGNGAAPVGQWFRAMSFCDIASVDTLSVVGALVSDASAGQRSSTRFSLGAGLTGLAKANIAVAELLVTFDQPTAAEIAAIEAYGVARYGGSLFA